jgi:arabinose-5-phosphate isomerase
MEFDLDYARGVIRAEAEAINSVVKIVDAAFARAAEMIYNCHGSVILSGIGKAGIIGRKISATLASTGTPSHFLHPAEAVHGDLGRLRKNDIIIVLSFGGETDEVIRLINLVKQQDIKMIAITSSDDSTLSRHSDVTLCIGKLSEACPLGVAPSVSTTCMLAIGDAIAFTVMKARNFSVEDYVRFHPAGSLGAKLMTVEQSMMFKPGEKLPIVVDKKGKLTGIITDADLRRLISKQGKDAFAVRVRDVMTSRCKKIRRDALAAEATAIFHKYRIDELPVVDAQDKPVGLIDVQDVLTIKVVG